MLKNVRLISMIEKVYDNKFINVNILKAWIDKIDLIMINKKYQKIAMIFKYF